MNIGFTGTRHGLSTNQRIALRDVLSMYKLRAGHFVFRHGDCLGADAEAHEIVDDLRNVEIRIYPSNIEPMRAYKEAAIICKPKPPIDRNHDIVDASEILIACPNTKQEQTRSGTWATIRYARKLKKQITIIFPDGSVRHERLARS